LNGEPVPSLSRVILARNARSTICRDIARMMEKHDIIDKPIIDMAELEFWMSMLIGASPIAAIGAAQLAEVDEQSDESVEGADHADPVAARFGGAYDRDIRFEEVAILLEECVIETGAIPSKRAPHDISRGNRAQQFRTLYHANMLSSERITRLELIPRWSWDPHGDQFRANLAEFINESAQHPTGPFSPPVRRWISYCEGRRRRSDLPQERIDALTAAPGWVWRKNVYPRPRLQLAPR
jgi:hypothetical protein